MDHKQRAVRVAVAVMVCVLTAQLMRFLAEPVAKLVSDPEVASILVYLETGRVVKPVFQEMIPLATEETEPSQPTQPVPPAVTFSQEDVQLIQVSNFCSFGIDVPALLMTDLTWDLTDQQPRVLILHSHATESYTQTTQNTYEPSAAYRTLDPEHNMVRVGQALKETLEGRGITVIHDRTLHDHPSYSDAYIQSREAVQQWLQRYPSICLVIDLHRDAAGDSPAKQLSTEVTVNGKVSAQLMMVVGSNAGGRQHPNWKENFALAAKLHAQLEKQFPGICRPISFRTERFNQDLSPGALLIEVGAAGDTLEEALAAADFLAEGIYALAFGAVKADSTS